MNILALWDSEFGFPNTLKGKCTKVAYGELDNFELETVYTGKSYPNSKSIDGASTGSKNDEKIETAK